MQALKVVFFKKTPKFGRWWVSSFYIIILKKDNLIFFSVPIAL